MLLSGGNSGSPVLAVSCRSGEFELVGVYHAGYRRGAALNVVVGIDAIRELMTTLRPRKKVPERRLLTAADRAHLVPWLSAPAAAPAAPLAVTSSGSDGALAMRCSTSSSTSPSRSSIGASTSSRIWPAPASARSGECGSAAGTAFWSGPSPSSRKSTGSCCMTASRRCGGSCWRRATYARWPSTPPDRAPPTNGSRPSSGSSRVTSPAVANSPGCWSRRPRGTALTPTIPWSRSRPRSHVPLPLRRLRAPRPGRCRQRPRVGPDPAS